MNATPPPWAGAMPGDPRLRVSDAERDRTVELLREHHAVGRLSAQEYEERMHSVLTAKTRGELDQALGDLPAIDLYQLPSAGIARRGAGGGGRLARPGGANLPRRIPPQAAVAAVVLAGFGVGLALSVILNSGIPVVVITILVLVAVVAARRRPH